MQRRRFLIASLAGTAALPSMGRAAIDLTAGDVSTSRANWLAMLDRVASPVLHAAAEGRLQQLMPVEAAAGMEADRRKVTHLEAVGRTLSGLAPWLEHGSEEGAEGELLRRYRAWSLAAIEHGVEPHSPAYLRFGEERQTVVDAGFLALALHRAPKMLRDSLSAKTRQNLIAALEATRHQTPSFNNWLLFMAMIEVALAGLGADWDRTRVDYALREHASWYAGDGLYSDGPHFHVDYYNSFVIHPFLLAVLEAVGDQDPGWRTMIDPARARSVRYAVELERVIAPDGSYPVIGRSITYRCGAFQLLADVATRAMLPAALPPGQVRCALHAVIERTLGAPGTFDAQGWLQIGLAGHQPALGETYISTGSLYLCTAAFLPLGLPPTDTFWTEPDLPWTSRRVWGGENLVRDHAFDEVT
jgi:hypothetical protein